MCILSILTAKNGLPCKLFNNFIEIKSTVFNSTVRAAWYHMIKYDDVFLKVCLIPLKLTMPLYIVLFMLWMREINAQCLQVHGNYEVVKRRYTWLGL